MGTLSFPPPINLNCGLVSPALSPAAAGQRQSGVHGHVGECAPLAGHTPANPHPADVPIGGADDTHAITPHRGGLVGARASPPRLVVQSARANFIGRIFIRIE